TISSKVGSDRSPKSPCGKVRSNATSDCWLRWHLFPRGSYWRSQMALPQPFSLSPVLSSGWHIPGPSRRTTPRHGSYLKVAGSNPAPAAKLDPTDQTLESDVSGFSLRCRALLRLSSQY